jgi:hypothetical protein
LFEGGPRVTRIWPSIASAVAHSRHTAHAPLTWSPADHLMSRFAFGPTPGGRAYIIEHGPTPWFAHQLTYAKTYRGYGGNARVAKAGPLLTKTPAQVRAYLKAHGNEYGWDAMDQLTRVTLGLQSWSAAQVYETMVDFFANHLNVANHNGDVWHTRHAFDRDVIRKYAMGSFTDMLLASARHPAMLIFLNLAESTKQAINENYGRELLELHTVGLNYTENDVKNAARILTGRTLDESWNSYHYDPSIHWTGAIKVLGFRHANSSAAGGQAAGDALLRYLAAHPDTASHLARKLCVRFVSDAPSAALVAAVAKAYLKGKTQIEPMIKTILCSDEFWQSRGAKVRRPTENLIATMRILGTPVHDMGDALATLHWMTADMGNAPLDWAAPNGYPDVAAAWRSSSNLLAEWNLNLGFAGDWWGGFGKTDKTRLYGRTPKNSGDAIDLLTVRLTGIRFSKTHKAALQKFLGEPASTPMKSSRLQWLLYPLIALILDAPHHALR